MGREACEGGGEPKEPRVEATSQLEALIRLLNCILNPKWGGGMREEPKVKNLE